MHLDTLKTHCPHCGEMIELVVESLVDPQGEPMDYIEDCQVCCRPMTVIVTTNDGYPEVSVFADN